MSAPRTRALLLAVLMLAPTATILSAHQAAGQTGDIPVAFEPASISKANLHFWREGTNSCQDDGNQQTPVGICTARIDPIPNNDDQTEQETRAVESNAQQTLGSQASVRFTLDTDGPGGIARKGAQFPFQILGGGQAVQFSFWYDSDAVCERIAGSPQGQPIGFRMRLLRTTNPDDPSAASQIPGVNVTTTACGTPGGQLTASDANRVAVSVNLSSPVQIAQDEAVVAEITAFDPDANPGPSQWAIFFESASRDSKVVLRTDRIVDEAVWPTDKSGALQRTFNPNASSSERFMVGRMAIRSPFGPAAVPERGFSGEIEAPDGSLVDLITETEDTKDASIAMRTIEGLEARNGSLKVYKFRKPADHPQPWHYEEGVDAGPYEIRVSGTILERGVTFRTSAAMGAFQFSLGPVDGETTNHDFRRGTSTTFLLRLENKASQPDTYKVNENIEFSQGGSWSADVIGVDRDNEVSLDPDEQALIRVRLIPPSSATTGDAARVNVTATSQASESSKSLTLQGSITDQTVRDVGLFVLRGPNEPFPVGVDETTEIQVFAWNQGTATDSIEVSFVDGSFEPDDPSRFDASLVKRTFENIQPGGIARVPIQVTTTDAVDRNDTFQFDVQASSTNVPEETSDPLTVHTVVRAVRGFDVFALDGRNPEALQSKKFAKYNISEPSGPVAVQCESEGNTGPQYDRNCRDWTNVTYHRLTIHNTGDVAETFRLSRQAVSFTHSGQGCNPVLDGSGDPRWKGAAFVPKLDNENPGSEDPLEDGQLTVQPGDTKRVYLRVAFNGSTPIWGEIAPDEQPCDWDAYKTTVKVDMLDSQRTKLIPTTTKIFAVHPSSSDFERAAKARLALQAATGHNGTFVEVPQFSTIEPGQNTTIPFTLSNQAGHFDPINLTLGPRNVIQDLREKGWTIELVSLDGTPVRTLEDAGVFQVPTKRAFGNATGGHMISHTTGADFALGIKVQAPSAGVQEDVRHTFTVEATSSFDARVQDSIGLGIQVGSDFAFNLVEGVQEIEAPAGDRVGFGLTIENTGATRDTYRISASGSPAAFQDPLVRPQRVTISPGSQKAIAIETSTEGAQPGSTGTLNVQVTADAGTDTEQDDIGPRTVEYAVNVRQSGTLSMQAEQETVRIGPGGQNVINFTITNERNTERTVRISELIAPAGFDTTLSEGNDTKTIGPQNSRTFSYVIQAPQDIVEGSLFTFLLRVEDTEDTSDFATGLGHASVIGETAVRLEAEEARKVVDRNGNTSFPVLVHNPGTSPTWYELTPQASSAGWTTQVLDAQGQPIENASVRVAEKTFKRVLIDVSAPKDVAKGHVENVTLRAAAIGQRSVSDSISMKAAIHDYAIGIEVTGAIEKDAIPADNVDYSVTLTNQGNGKDTIELTFEGPKGEDPIWDVSTELSEDTTPTLKPGESLRDVSVTVHVPGPGEGPVPSADGVTSVIRATSLGAPATGGAPTATTQVTTRLVDYVRFDIDGDTAFEMGVDLNRDASDGFEVFADRDPTLIDRGVLDEAQSRVSTGLATIDGDDDGRIEHIVDTNGDGIGEKYFDPDRAQAYTIPYTVDVDGDGQPDHPVDADFDGRIDGVHDAGDDTVRQAVNLDFSGDGRRDLLVDTDGDTFFDTFVNPHTSPPIITGVERNGDLYKLDTDDDGEVDTHYNVQTQSIEDARTANLETFLEDYWWFLLVFLLVLGLFGVIVYRRL